MPGELAAQSPDDGKPASVTNGSPPPAAPPKWKRYRASAIIFALGLGLLLSAHAVYPSPETGIPIPPYPRLVISTNRPVAEVYYSVKQYSGVAKLSITVAVSGSQPAGTMEIDLPQHYTFRGGCGFLCQPLAIAYGPARSTRLNFSAGKASASYDVNANSFGVDTNGVNAYAALPEVSYELTGALPGSTAPPTFWANYQIPHARSYDWSSFPPASYRGAIIWKELLTLTTGDTAGRAALGIDHTREASDTTWTFIAGALLGLGGGALLAAIQDALSKLLS